ncbi:hypothetical protein QK908_02265 [Lactococcus cremoris]
MVYSAYPRGTDEYKEKVRREQLTYSVEILKDELEENMGKKILVPTERS